MNFSLVKISLNEMKNMPKRSPIFFKINQTCSKSINFVSPRPKTYITNILFFTMLPA